MGAAIVKLLFRSNHFARTLNGRLTVPVLHVPCQSGITGFNAVAHHAVPVPVQGTLSFRHAHHVNVFRAF